MNTFKYKGKEYEYIDSQHNATRQNERGVELAFIKSFLEQYDNLIEIGAVSPYYFEDYTHKVYDLTDKHPRAENMDARSLDVAGKNILCVSTVEHFDKDAIEFIERIMNTSKKYLITFPLGYNHTVDKNSRLDMWALTNGLRFMGRKSSVDPVLREEWVEKTVEDLDIRYGTPRWANTIVVIENSL